MRGQSKAKASLLLRLMQYVCLVCRLVTRRRTSRVRRDQSLKRGTYIGGKHSNRVPPASLPRRDGERPGHGEMRNIRHTATGWTTNHDRHGERAAGSNISETSTANAHTHARTHAPPRANRIPLDLTLSDHHEQEVATTLVPKTASSVASASLPARLTFE